MWLYQYVFYYALCCGRRRERERERERESKEGRTAPILRISFFPLSLPFSFSSRSLWCCVPLVVQPLCVCCTGFMRCRPFSLSFSRFSCMQACITTLFQQLFFSPFSAAFLAMCSSRPQRRTTQAVYDVSLDMLPGSTLGKAAAEATSTQTTLALFPLSFGAKAHWASPPSHQRPCHTLSPGRPAPRRKCPSTGVAKKKGRKMPERGSNAAGPLAIVSLRVSEAATDAIGSPAADPATLRGRLPLYTSKA